MKAMNFIEYKSKFMTNILCKFICLTTDKENPSNMLTETEMIFILRFYAFLSC